MFQAVAQQGQEASSQQKPLHLLPFIQFCIVHKQICPQFEFGKHTDLMDLRHKLADQMDVE